MKKLALTAAIAAVLSSFGGLAVTSAQAGDACAGQTWPNLSSACIDQRTRELSDIVNKGKK